MTIALIAALLVALAVAGVLALELRRVRSVYESLYQVLLADRDIARAQVQQAYEDMIPGLKFVPPQKTALPQTQEQKAAAIRNSRSPERVKSKLLTALFNTAQRNRDALAAALPQEKKNG